ncbi:fimbrial protein [Enterobacter chuandaensis]|uniref:fimbrial protein n=1 Tax=Enterobacter chuandaensis TaxID=2497875 RepID=UPI002074BED6|nr:fimbrial protein [Enterobacter chuandaensis]MCM7587704.1 fimbrial protein [Enterobacter chuandaensis]
MFLMKPRNVFLLSMLAVSGFIFTSHSRAVNSININLGSVVIDKSARVGDPISHWVTSSTMNTLNFCGGGYFRSDLMALRLHSGISYEGKDVFNTGVHGVGFVIGAKEWVDNEPHGDWFFILANTDFARLIDKGISEGCHSIYNNVMIRLIKTSSSIDSQPLSDEIGFIEYTEDNTILDSTYIYLNGTIVTSSCSVTTPNTIVPLGKHKRTEFTHVGSVTEWENFAIGLDCDANVNINVEINAVPVPDSPSGSAIMRLDDPAGEATAKGTGIELRYQDHVPLLLNHSSLYKTTVRSGPELIKLKARYYQTQPNVTPGVANGTATFTLTYK